jgi:hypothetical protein
MMMAWEAEARRMSDSVDGPAPGVDDADLDLVRGQLV